MEIKKLPTLLLVTQSTVTQSFFKTTINELEDYALICTQSELEALEYLNKTYISFIVIDEKTPDIELTILCSKIRQLKDYTHTPILIITSHLKKTFTRNLLKAGATDFLRHPLEKDDFFHRMEMSNEIMDTQKKITALSTFLPNSPSISTSLKKRAIMDNRATKIVEKALFEKSTLSALLIEIDQYEKIHKSQKENVTNALLIDFENHLQNLMRQQDLLFNQNQGKFAVLMPKTSEKGSQFIAENIQEYLEIEVFSYETMRFNFTVSIGVSNLEKSGDPTKNEASNLERLLSSALICLNEAKKKGNTVVTQSQMQGKS